MHNEIRCREDRSSMQGTDLVFTGERIVPAATDIGDRNVVDYAGILMAHIARYAFALPLIAGKQVFEAGCGVGYGTEILSYAAKGVLAADKDFDGLEVAKRYHDRPNILWLCDDVVAAATKEDVMVGAKPFNWDICVAFELVEHLEDPGPFLEAVSRKVCIISIPNDSNSPVDEISPFHTRHFSLNSALNLLMMYFGEIEAYSQFGTAFINEGRSDAHGWMIMCYPES